MNHSDYESKEWKRWIEKYNPDQWATFTFPSSVSLSSAKKKLDFFFIKMARMTKQHIFAPYGCDSQPLRSCSESDYHPHFHCFVCYEKKPISPIVLGLHWETYASFEREDGSIKKGRAFVAEYNPFQNGIAYTFLNHKEHQFSFYCPRNKSRCNRKDRVCHFAKHPHHWKARETHTTEMDQDLAA